MEGRIVDPRKLRLLSLVPPPVRQYLLSPRPEIAPLDGGQRWSVLLGDVRTALEGARHEALRLGADVRILPELLAGEARSASRRLAVAGACAGNLVRRAGTPQRRLVTLFGGETTVTVKGSGSGGRNRELALATAFHIDGVRGAHLLVAGTDGVDNTADAAGAFVDDTTLTRAAALGLDASAALDANDSVPSSPPSATPSPPVRPGRTSATWPSFSRPGAKPSPRRPCSRRRGFPSPTGSDPWRDRPPLPTTPGATARS